MPTIILKNNWEGSLGSDSWERKRRKLIMVNIAETDSPMYFSFFLDIVLRRYVSLYNLLM